MFSKELESLIQASLEDGKLDDIEKGALVKRAQAEGVDLAELEIYINSLLQKRQKELNAKEDEREQERLNQKKKEIGKVCPHCGTPIPPMAEKCPSCGMVILTAAINEKIEKEMKEIREKFKQGLSVNLEDAAAKRNAIGYINAAKSQLVELATKYSTVPQVQTFSALMNSEIDKGLEKIEKKKTEEVLWTMALIGFIAVVAIGFGIALLVSKIME